MRQQTKRYIVFLWALTMTFCTALAQITGVVVDAEDGAPVPYASAMYKGNKVAVASDANGKFSIPRHMGWRLTFSSVGYQQQVINVGPSTPNYLVIRLKPESRKLQEVTVKSKKKSRYKRKDNPAVDFMRKVIAAKKKNDIHKHDYFRYTNYQKLSVALNDLNSDDLQKGLFKRYPWLVGHVEVSQYNDKLVLPLTMNETVSERLYRKQPKRELTHITGKQSIGLNDLFQTGDIVTTLIKDIFSDVDIYDDYIMLLRHKFSSPIGRDAIQFYRFYLTDTLYIGHDQCIQLDFVANNQQDFGFRGRIYVLTDGSYQVKRCELTFPKTNDVNWVDGLQCMQEFTKQPNGDWLLTIDDMIVELAVTDFMAKALVTRTTRYKDFDFSPIAAKEFRNKADEETDAEAAYRDSTFWAQHREVELSASEKAMGSFLDEIEQQKGYKIAILVLKALFENYLETGTRERPSKFDVGPLNTSVSQNFYDGLRLRLSGQTTANLNPHLFLKGYYAYGTRHHDHYYNAEMTYSLRRCEYLPQEFPVRNISFSSKRDVALPSDKYISTDKDNVFSSFKVHEIDKMLMYNTQQLTFDYETLRRTRFTASLKTEKITPKGNIAFQPLNTSLAPLPTMRYTEGTVGVRIAPKERFFNTKQRRRTTNKDAWYVSLQHTTGFNHFIGGQYDYNFTEIEGYRRNWLPMSWGHLDVRLKAGVQWNQVPYPLLIMPQANLSYIHNFAAFSMINNMEFLNDRYASLMLTWELDGKIFNRIPLLKKLKWRELLELKGLWGHLSKKNNPYMAENAGSSVLMHFPEGSYIMDGKKPYIEYGLGIQNIFHLFQVEYVRRVNYLDLPGAHKHGIRVLIVPTF